MHVGYIDRMAMRVADLEGEFQAMAQRCEDERQLNDLAAGLIAVKEQLRLLRRAAADANDEMTQNFTLSFQRLLARFARTRAEAA
jgi:hypothetical protein